MSDYNERLKALDSHERRIVSSVCEQIGYGRTMQLAEVLWRERLESEGTSGGEHTTGPCARFMVACECRERGERHAGEGYDSCDWCCGAGRVTEHVRKVQLERASK